MLEGILLNIILKKIKKAADRYGEENYDIVHNSPSACMAYTRGYALGGLCLGTMCQFWWNIIHDGTDGTPPPSAGMQLQQ